MLLRRRGRIGYEGQPVVSAQALVGQVAPLFASGEKGVAYAPSPTTCFTDVGLTTPAPVNGASGTLYLRDLSPNGVTATLSNAVLQRDGSRYYIAFNGTTTSGVTAAIDFTGTDKMTVWAGFRRDGVARAMLVELSAIISNNGSFNIEGPGADGDVTPTLRGTANAQTRITGTSATGSATVVQVSYDIGGALLADEIAARLNAQTATLFTAVAGPAGTGNFGNYAIYIGRRGGTTLPFSGRLYSLIVRGAASDASAVGVGESFVNARTGAY